MDDTTTPANDVLRRMVRVDRPEPQEEAMSPARAVRVALARAADQALALPLRVGSIRQNRLDLADVVDLIDEAWALFPIVHDDGEIGAICANPNAAFAFVEQQTTGRLRESGAPERALTRTDRALTQPVGDLFLRLFDDTMAGAPNAFWTQGYRCEDPVPTRHMLALQLEANEYRVFEIALEFVGTQRHGQMLLILPIKAKAAPVKKGKDNKGSALAADGKGSPALKSAALPAQVALDAVLCRIKVPLSQLRGLELGTVLAVPRTAMHAARLEDATGKTSIPVHLGQLHGARAVRLLSGEDRGALAKAGQAGRKPMRVPAALSETTSAEKGHLLGAASASGPVSGAQQDAAEGQTGFGTDSDAAADADLDALLAQD